MSVFVAARLAKSVKSVSAERIRSGLYGQAGNKAGVLQSKICKDAARDPDCFSGDLGTLRLYCGSNVASRQGAVAVSFKIEESPGLGGIRVR